MTNTQKIQQILEIFKNEGFEADSINKLNTLFTQLLSKIVVGDGTSLITFDGTKNADGTYQVVVSRANLPQSDPQVDGLLFLDNLILSVSQG